MTNPFDLIDSRLSNIENLLLDLKQTHQAVAEVAPSDELLTVQDTAQFLSLTVPTVYGLISKGEIPVMRRSKRCYFLKADLIEYLKAGRKRTNAEIADAADKATRNKQK